MGIKFVLSSARQIKTSITDKECTEPLFAEDTSTILDKLKNYAPWELESILKANANIAMKAFVDIQDFHCDETITPAMFAYDGLVYKHLAPFHLSNRAAQYSQSVMRIISALYGLLRPFDGIRPYRLEMQSKIKINDKSLYDFWDDKIYRSLFESGNCVINLASEEYAKTIRKHLNPWDMFIDIIFLSNIKGRRKISTTTAKMARDQMARFILENAIDTPGPLKDFDWGGFRYVKSLSYSTRYVYIQHTADFAAFMNGS